MHTHTQNNCVVEVHQRREKEAKEQIELEKNFVSTAIVPLLPKLCMRLFKAIEWAFSG